MMSLNPKIILNLGRFLALKHHTDRTMRKLSQQCKVASLLSVKLVLNSAR